MPETTTPSSPKYVSISAAAKSHGVSRHLVFAAIAQRLIRTQMVGPRLVAHAGDVARWQPDLSRGRRLFRQPAA